MKQNGRKVPISKCSIKIWTSLIQNREQRFWSTLAYFISLNVLSHWLPHGGSNIFKVTCRNLGSRCCLNLGMIKTKTLHNREVSPEVLWNQKIKKTGFFTSKWQWLKTTTSHPSPSMNTEPQTICSRTFTQSAIYDSSSNYLIWSHPCYANFPLKWWQISLI